MNAAEFGFFIMESKQGIDRATLIEKIDRLMTETQESKELSEVEKFSIGSIFLLLKGSLLTDSEQLLADHCAKFAPDWFSQFEKSN